MDGDGGVLWRIRNDPLKVNDETSDKMFIPLPPPTLSRPSWSLHYDGGEAIPPPTFVSVSATRWGYLMNAGYHHVTEDDTPRDMGIDRGAPYTS